MTVQQNKSPPSHTPEPWEYYGIPQADGFHAIYTAHFPGCDTGEETLIATVYNERDVALIESVPKLLTAVEDAFTLLDRISDILHYKDGLPVTVLESRDIEIIYGDAVTELARFETLIREARGQT